MNDDLCVVSIGGKGAWVVVRAGGPSAGLRWDAISLLPFVYAAVLLALLLLPSPVVGVVIPDVVGGDLLHVPAFLLLAVFSAAAYLRFYPANVLVAAMCVWFAVALFGVSTELAQMLVGRTASFSDVAVDVLSALSGVLLVAAWYARRPVALLFGLSGGIACLLAIIVPFA